MEYCFLELCVIDRTYKMLDPWAENMNVSSVNFCASIFPFKRYFQFLPTYILRKTFAAKRLIMESSGFVI